MVDGLNRYIEYCKRRGWVCSKVNLKNEKVLVGGDSIKLTSTFLGNKRHFENEYDIPSVQQAGSISKQRLTIADKHRRMNEMLAEIEVNNTTAGVLTNGN